MIIFNGIIYRNKIPFLVFKNQLDKITEIPIDLVIADRISSYLSQIVITEPAPTEISTEEAD